MSDLFTNQSGNEAQNADKKLMDRREGEISKGKLPGVYYEKVTFDQLAEGFLRDKIKDFRSAWFSACKAAGLGRRPFSRFQEDGNSKHGPFWNPGKSRHDDIRS
jgi:hypothetical protein